MDFHVQLNLCLYCQILLDRPSKEIIDQMRKRVAISQNHVRAVCVCARIFRLFLSETQVVCTDILASCRCPLLKMWKKVVKGKRAGEGVQEEERILSIDFLSKNSAHLQQVIID